MRTVTYGLADLNRATISIGYVGENESTQVVFDSRRVFDDYPAAVASLTVKPPVGPAYPAVTIREGDLVTWSVQDSDLVHPGYGELQLAFVENAVIVKTYIAKVRIDRSITPDGEAPTPIQNWIDEANGVLGTISGARNEAVTARNEAVAASGTAVSAAGSASGSATAAGNSATAAGNSATAAAGSATAAGNSAAAAAASAASANHDADRAEQAANTAGYMEIEIDASGHLIYTKTEAIGNNFDLNSNGHLILEVG